MGTRTSRISFRSKLILFGVVMVSVVGAPFLAIEARRPWLVLDEMIEQGFGLISGFEAGIGQEQLQQMIRFALRTAGEADEEKSDYLVWSFNLLLAGDTLPTAEEVTATLKKNEVEVEDFDYQALVAAAQFWRDRFASDPDLLERCRIFKRKLITAKEGAAAFGFEIGDLYLMADDGKSFTFVLDGFEWYESTYPGMIYDVKEHGDEYWRGYLTAGPGYYTNPKYHRFGLLPKFDTDEWGTWFTIWKAAKTDAGFSVFSIDFDAAAVKEQMWRIGLTVFAGTVVLLLSIILISSRLSRNISTPINHLVAGTEAVIREDLDHVVPEVDSPEFQKPIEVFNRMIRKLKEMRELEVSYQALKDLDAMKDNFLSMVSHDLRTPMTSIKGYASILKKRTGKITPEEQKEYLDIIINESDRLTRLVNDLLDLQRLEQGRMALNFVELDLAELAAKSVESFQGAAQAKNLRLTVSSISSNPRVVVDRDRMSQIVANLLSNAIKFTPESGTIEVTVEEVNGEKGRGVKVSVRDSGIGIPADQIPSLFSRFQQVKSLDRRKQEGSGLGLALVRELINQFGGEVGVESVINQGSVFFFILWSVSAGEG